MTKHTQEFQNSAARVFKYSGSVRHIKAYMDKNRKNGDCIVEVFVRQPTQIERELYGFPVRVLKREVAGRATAGSKSTRSNAKVEARPRKISGADLSRWKAKVQEQKVTQ